MKWSWLINSSRADLSLPCIQGSNYFNANYRGNSSIYETFLSKHKKLEITTSDKTANNTILTLAYFSSNNQN